MNEIRSITLDVIGDKIIRLKNEIGRNTIEIGNEPIRAKKEVSHGEWEKWLRDKVSFSQRSMDTRIHKLHEQYI